MNQSRWTSPVVWLSVIGQVVAILLALGVINTGIGDQINEVAASILQLLVLFGMLNNPTNADGF